jgi:hypothetical protein
MELGDSRFWNCVVSDMNQRLIKSAFPILISGVFFFLVIAAVPQPKYSLPAQTLPSPQKIITLIPITATQLVGTPQTVTATVVAGEGQPLADQTVQFAVTGANSPTDSGTTTTNGQVTFTYTGIVPGDDIITAWIDENGDGEPDSDEPTAVVKHTLVAQWTDTCANHRMEISGVGMGDATIPINPQTLSLADPSRVNWLLAQVAGRYSEDAPTPESETFTTGTPQIFTLVEPTRNSAEGYTFEASLQPTGQITASLSNIGGNYQTPRGLILYAKRDTGHEKWTSVGKTTNEFVYWQEREAYTEILTFTALAEPTDLTITAAVIDNNVDDRPLVLEAEAGSVMTRSELITGPTEGDLLNIVSLTLPNVPTGTDRVAVTLRSPGGSGDSLVLVGVNASYLCTNTSSIYLPTIYKNFEPLICSNFSDDFSDSDGGWQKYNPPPIKSGYSNGEFFIERQSDGFDVVPAPVNFANRYTIEVDVRWNDVGYEYGIIFGQAASGYPNYSFGIDSTRGRYRVLYNISYYDWECVTRSADHCWLDSDHIELGSATNQLEVKCEGVDAKLSINQNALPSIPEYESFSCGGQGGLFTQSSPRDKTSIAFFDNFCISCPFEIGITEVSHNVATQILTKPLSFDFRQ